MFWLIEVLGAILAIFILALTGLLGKTAKRHSRKLSGKIWRGVKRHTKARWQARRNKSRGIKPAKKRTPTFKPVATAQPIAATTGSEYSYDYIPCNAETQDGTWCTRNRMRMPDGTRLDHCWQHPSKGKSRRGEKVWADIERKSKK